MANVLERSSPVYWCRPTKRQSGSCCVAVSTPPLRPDPAIYSQDQVMQQGGIPSWDSPDITTNNDIPWTLRPETVVTVRNLSPHVTAVNTQVQVSISGFGIGLPKTQLSNQLVTLPPAQDRTFNFALSQAVLSGAQSIGVFVQLYHPNDAVEINSHGVVGVIELDEHPDALSAGQDRLRQREVEGPVLGRGQGDELVRQLGLGQADAEARDRHLDLGVHRRDMR